MADVGERFTEAVADGDFVSSGEILDGSFSDGEIQLVADKIRAAVECADSSDLRYRDHVFAYLDLEAVYFALQIPCYELVYMLRGAAGKDDAIDDAYELVVTLAQMNDPSLVVREINVDRIRETDFAVLLPWVLSRRLEEIQKVTIAYSPRDAADDAKRYCIVDLLDTYYGRKVVWAARGRKAYLDPYETIVVGQDVYEKVRIALENLDVDPDSILEEVSPNEWYKYVRDVTRRRFREQGSMELKTVADLITTIDLTSDEDVSSHMRLMTTIEQMRTSACNSWLVDVARGNRTVDIVSRTRSIDLLGTLGGAVERDVISALLPSSDQEIRRAAAISLSKIESRLAWGGRPRGAPPRSSEDVDRLSSSLAMIAGELTRLQDSSHDSLVKSTIEALATIPGARSEDILKGLMRHPSELVRQTIVESSTPLPRGVAAGIIRLGLRDESKRVVAAAQRVMETRWGDDVWMQDNSEFEGEDDEIGSSKP
jgi:hypothetical protein